MWVGLTWRVVPVRKLAVICLFVGEWLPKSYSTGNIKIPSLPYKRGLSSLSNLATLEINTGSQDKCVSYKTLNPGGGGESHCVFLKVGGTVVLQTHNDHLDFEIT